MPWHPCGVQWDRFFPSIFLRVPGTKLRSWCLSGKQFHLLCIVPIPRDPPKFWEGGSFLGRVSLTVQHEESKLNTSVHSSVTASGSWIGVTSGFGLLLVSLL